MALNFGNKNSGGPDELRECVKKILLESGGNVEALRGIITNAIKDLQTDDALSGVLSPLSNTANSIGNALGDFSDGLPLSDVIPSSQLRPPINVTKTASDIVNDLNSRCTDFFLAALDQLDPLTRLEQLLDLVNDLCGQLNFTDLRKVIDKVQQTQRDVIRDTIDQLTTPLEKVAKLNDMLVDAINSGSQEAIDNIDALLEEVKYQQLYDYINSLDPAEAAARLQEEIKSRTQLNDYAGVRDALNALQVLESSFNETVDSLLTPLDDVQKSLESLLPNTEDLFNLPEDILNSAQDKINEALDLGNYDSINDVITALDNIQNNALSTLQNLDPQILLQKGVTLLNEALESGDLGRYNRILDDLAQKLCAPDQLGNIPSLPDFSNLNIQLPSPLA